MQKRQIKFTEKLIIYNLILFFVIMFLVTAVFYFRVWRDTKQRAQRDFAALAEKTTSQFDQLIYNMDKTALQIAANPAIVSHFAKLPPEDESNYFIDNPLLAGELVKLLNSYNFKRDGNSRICLYNDHHDFLYSATTMTTTEGTEAFFDSEDYKHVRSAFAANDVYRALRAPGADILNTSELPSPPYFAVIRQIKDYYSGTQKNGYVEVQQSTERLDDIFADLGEGCYAAIYINKTIKTEGERRHEPSALIYESPALRGLEDRGIRAFFEELPEAKTEDGVREREGFFTAQYRCHDAELSLVFLKETKSLMAPLYHFLLLLILIFIFLLIIVFISEKTLLTRLTEPLAELQHSVRQVGIDNLKLEIPETEDNDELRELNLAFNAVLSRLEEEIEEKVLSQTNELKAHLFALQSQMNPHFIYNTLAIVSMEAELAGHEKTVAIIAALAEMMKYTGSMGDGTAALGEELRHAENYLSLMKERYEDEFEYEIQADPALNAQRVPKLLLQPLCENSFKHAFMSIEGKMRIRIVSRKEGRHWLLSAEDNGSGFPPELILKLERFKENLSLATMRKTLESAEPGGLTLENTCLRLYLTYGENFIFKAENTEEGSRVILGGDIR